MSNTESEWYVYAEEYGKTVRGPYQTAREAGAVREEMEQHDEWDKVNLQIRIGKE